MHAEQSVAFTWALDDMQDLHPDHRADLAKSGLNAETIRSLGIHSVPPGEIAQHLGFDNPQISSVLCFPYPSAEGFCRDKIFPAIKDTDGHSIRYLQRKGSGVRLYIPPLAQAVLTNPTVSIAIVEGEKKAAKACQEKLPTVGTGGLWNFLQDGELIRDFDRIALQGRVILLIPDSDVWHGREDLLQAVFALGMALEARGASVRVLKLPPVSDGKAGMDDFLVTRGREALPACERILLSSPIFAEAQRREERRQERRANNSGGTFGGFVSSPRSGSKENVQDAPWPEPGELPSGLLLVPSLAEAMIPEPFRLWLTDIAERIQCPLEFPTVGALVSLAGLVGRRIGIRPKRHDDWLVTPNLWGAAIGRPGILKSPALAEVMNPLQRLEIQARAAYEDARNMWEVQKLVLKAQREEAERVIRAAVREGNDAASIAASVTLPGEEDGKPILVRYIVNDTTVEKLGELLNQNPHGLLLFRDELTGWLRTLDREGHENDRAFYLEAWNGNGAYTYDRIGRGTLHIKAACVSILGGIQPGPLADYLRAAVRGGSGDDGLMQRFQLAVYPDDPRDWKNVDRWPETEAKNLAFAVFHQLAKRPVSELGVTFVPAVVGAPGTADEEIPFLRFSPQAQELFDQWRADLEAKIRAREEHPALEAHLAKYRSLMPSLALPFHLLDIVVGRAEGAVSQRAAAMAAAWCDFLEAHARRIYQGVTQHALFAARQLAERIKAGKLPNPFTPHNVYHNGWIGLSTPEDVERAAEVLEELAWVRSERIPSGQRGGRPRFHYHINPRLIRERKPA